MPAAVSLLNPIRSPACRPIVRQPALGRHTGSVILLHGLGDTAEGELSCAPDVRTPLSVTTLL